MPNTSLPQQPEPSASHPEGEMEGGLRRLTWANWIAIGALIVSVGSAVFQYRQTERLAEAQAEAKRRAEIAEDEKKHLSFTVDYLIFPGDATCSMSILVNDWKTTSLRVAQVTPISEDKMRNDSIFSDCDTKETNDKNKTVISPFLSIFSNHPLGMSVETQKADQKSLLIWKTVFLQIRHDGGVHVDSVELIYSHPVSDTLGSSGKLQPMVNNLSPRDEVRRTIRIGDLRPNESIIVPLGRIGFDNSVNDDFIVPLTLTWKNPESKLDPSQSSIRPMLPIEHWQRVSRNGSDFLWERAHGPHANPFVPRAWQDLELIIPRSSSRQNDPTSSGKPYLR
jgi:hypothetical protein